jgi:ATP-binding cassette subfamily B protein
MSRKYVHVRQHGASDCGTAALAAVIAHHGRPVEVESLRALTGNDRSGTDMLSLRDAATHLGFEAGGYKAHHVEELLSVPLPAIAHTKNEDGLPHFVIVHKVTKKSVLVADPASDEVEDWSREKFRKSFTGNLLVVVPGTNRPTSDDSSAPATPARRFAALLAGHTPLLAEAIACALLMTVLGLANSYFIQHLIDFVLVRNEVRLLNALGLGMALVLVFRSLFGLVRRYLLAFVGRRATLGLVAGYARHILRLPLGFFESRSTGEIVSRVHDTDKIREAISGTTLTVAVDAVLVLLSLGVLWAYDRPLAAVATAFLPLQVAVVLLHQSALRRRSREVMEQGARLVGHMIEGIGGVDTVKALGIEDKRAGEVESHLVRYVRPVFTLQLIALRLEALTTLIIGAADLAVLWWGGHRVMAGAMSIGELMFFFSMLTQLTDPLGRLASVNLAIQEALVAVGRVAQVQDLPAEPIDGSGKATFIGVSEAVVLQDVRFGYGRRDPVLNGINMRIPAGKKVAIVGKSGSGKSTLVKILMGYYPPTSGRLLIDGVDFRDINLASFRARVGLVSQEPFIFTGSVRENIGLGSADAGLSRVDEAARAAGLEEFINTLPDRYETIIGERGANLSGGQRQRMAIARALARRPEILLFDEATSHLDTATEQAIQEGLQGLLAGRTVVLVAHRLSTIKNADLIYVLHEGCVVEEGTHEQLLAHGGRYADLWRNQVGPSAC